jgi:hypothetical protein
MDAIDRQILNLLAEDAAGIAENPQRQRRVVVTQYLGAAAAAGGERRDPGLHPERQFAGVGLPLFSRWCASNRCRAC